MRVVEELESCIDDGGCGAVTAEDRGWYHWHLSDSYLMLETGALRGLRPARVRQISGRLRLLGVPTTSSSAVRSMAAAFRFRATALPSGYHRPRTPHSNLAFRYVQST